MRLPISKALHLTPQVQLSDCLLEIDIFLIQTHHFVAAGLPDGITCQTFLASLQEVIETIALVVF